MFEYGGGSNEGTMWRAVVTALVAIILIMIPVGGAIFIVDVAFRNIFDLLLLLVIYFYLTSAFLLAVTTVMVVLVLRWGVMVISLVILTIADIAIIITVGAEFRLVCLFAVAMLWVVVLTGTILMMLVLVHLFVLAGVDALWAWVMTSAVIGIRFINHVFIIVV